MKFTTSLLLLFVLSSCGMQYHRPRGISVVADTSYIYALPYKNGRSHLLVQGYNSWFSHRGRLALDFKMKKGSEVTAARSGIVVRVEQGFTKGGVNKKYYRKANHVTIMHSDGSQAYYGHLQHDGALVHVGDTVQQGQVIARSGSTGYSAFPHLHLIVWGPTPGGGRSQLPIRFRTRKGVGYLKPGKWY